MQQKHNIREIMNKHEVVKYLLRNTNHGNNIKPDGGSAWAPSNVALCKYWGKRNLELNLPQTSSLSVSLGHKGAFTKIKHCKDNDFYILNGNDINSESKFAKRLRKYLDLFRLPNVFYQVEVNTNVPIAAGMASSACGFAALIKALNDLYSWKLKKTDLSILARLGSGSACRSLWNGFVEWNRGEDADGFDSSGRLLPYVWPDLRIGALIFSTAEKLFSSTDAMQITVNTSSTYSEWIKQCSLDLDFIKQAIATRDFHLLGGVSEGNAVAMHLLTLNASPSIAYSTPDTISAIEHVSELRTQGMEIYFTQDAGPNLQLLFMEKDERAVLTAFPGIEIITPFSDSKIEELILVDNSDKEIGSGEKIAIHQKALLHRAFSIIIYRKTSSGKIQILLQQRNKAKYHSAGLWANTCCGHPRKGEDIVDAGERRLIEEMGLTADLQDIGSFHYQASFNSIGLTENEIDHVLVGFDSSHEINPNPNEVQATAWIDLSDLQNDLSNNPDKYVVWLKQVLDIFLSDLKPRHEMKA